MRIFILRARISLVLSLRCARNHLKERNERCAHAKTTTKTPSRRHNKHKKATAVGGIRLIWAAFPPSLATPFRASFYYRDGNLIMHPLTVIGLAPTVASPFAAVQLAFCSLPISADPSCNSPSCFVISHQPAKKK